MNELVTVQQVARHFGVTRQAVMYWLKKGHLAGIRPTTPQGVRTVWLVEKAELDSFTPPRKRSWGSGQTA